MDHPPGIEEIEADGTLWRFDRSFLRSNWTCIWGRGCHGIGTEKAAELGHGCCSVGAELDGVDEAMTLAASAAALRPEIFEYHEQARVSGVFADADRQSTRVIDGACIFLNRPGFTGGAGCALHLAALAEDESPIDWKPSVCWQLPVKVDWARPGVDEERGDDAAGEQSEDGIDAEVATVRPWSRADWGVEGQTMAWCCTEGDRAYVGDRPVIDSLGAELEAMVGTEVYVELRRRLA